MTKKEEITNHIEEQLLMYGFTPNYDYKPNIGFKLTNNSETLDSIEVDSVSEAEDLVISFLPEFKKGNIFTYEKYSEDLPLYLRVHVYPPF